MYTRSNRIADAVSLIKKMNKNVDSRNDPIEAQIEKREFVNVLLNLGQITEAGLYSKEVFFKFLSSFPLVEHPRIDSVRSFFSAIEFSSEASFRRAALRHARIRNFITLLPPQKRSDAQKLGSLWELRVLHNLIGSRWDHDLDHDKTISLCNDLKALVVSMESRNELTDAVLEDARQSLNTAGSFLLSLDKRDDAGDLLKYALKLSDSRGISLSSNVRMIGRRDD